MAIFFSFEIFALCSSTCLWIWTSLGNKIVVFSTGGELLQILHWLDGELLGSIHFFVHLVRVNVVWPVYYWWIERVINATEQFYFTNMSVLGNITLSGLVFVIVHSRCTGHFLPKHFKYWHNKEILLWLAWNWQVHEAIIIVRFRYTIKCGMYCC